MPLHKDLREFVELLNSNAVDYLVVGAFAVAHHGFPRYTADLDLLIRPSAENVQRVLHVLAQFGFGSIGIQAADLDCEGKVVQLGVKPNRIDLITSLSGVSFDEAWNSREQGDLDGVAARFIGRSALLRNKESTGRAKDLGDAEELRKRFPMSPKKD
jgi:acetolactate synthase regulatory subunit